LDEVISTLLEMKEILKKGNKSGDIVEKS